jgi:group I intron endonuclease
MMNKTNSGVYFIQHIKSGMVYIGGTNDFKRRWRDHKCQLRKNRHDNPNLQSAWNKYGQQAFRFHKLEYCNVDQLNEREQHFLNIYMEKGLCYNVARDVTAPGLGKVHTEESKQKMSAAKKGKVCSTETRQRMSEASKNRSPEHRRNLAKALSNPSAETRHKMSASAKNKPPISDETRAKMREAQKNRPPISEETRRKMSEARTLHHARKQTEIQIVERDLKAA